MTSARVPSFLRIRYPPAHPIELIFRGTPPEPPGKGALPLCTSRRMWMIEGGCDDFCESAG
jgi:hypothetical protein